MLYYMQSMRYLGIMLCLCLWWLFLKVSKLFWQSCYAWQCIWFLILWQRVILWHLRYLKCCEGIRLEYICIRILSITWYWHAVLQYLVENCGRVIYIQLVYICSGYFLLYQCLSWQRNWLECAESSISADRFLFIARIVADICTIKRGTGFCQ